MRSSRIVAVVGVLLALGGGAAYASRGYWRPVVEAWQAPSIPEPTAYRPVATSSLPVRATTTPTTQPKPTPKPTPTQTQPTSTKPTKPVPTQPTPTTPPKESSSYTNPFEFVGERPKEVNLAVPFLSQAPKQNWDMPYQEACEEASLLMTRVFLQGKTSDFTPDEGDRLILDLVDYETRAGDPADVTLGRIAEIAEARYGLHTVIQSLTSIDQLKNAVANGYPVIIPASGKALKNPNFRNGGPPYHMLVVKGYLADGRIITNDPGTRKGKNYIYGSSLLFDAIHDWNGGDVPQGAKIVLVLMP